MATRGKQSSGSKSSGGKSTQKKSSRRASTRSTTSRAKSTPPTKSPTRSAAAGARVVANKVIDDKEKVLFQLVGHALQQETFRDRLLKDPEKTLRRFGYQVDPEVLQAIKNANCDLVKCVAAQFKASTGSVGST